ncbi:RNI-like protein [Rhizoclosmatium globosum]|uniref:RNI-like protein n=1 Tax=Rhizoclosmatium globosum TaxID=329046 RepID=A0A1Y2BQR6_9FUNG|nr:RNI-like protein [Rhizoclosmatium globosum]|eukprot:ORY37080.1 RNI-like protein [Rhizoclosmatium globosum]
MATTDCQWLKLAFPDITSYFGTTLQECTLSSNPVVGLVSFWESYFTGLVQHQIAKSTSVSVSTLQSVKTFNILPAGFGQLTKLAELDITDCGFTGPIPAGFFANTQLNSLLMGLNPLNSQFPTGFGSLGMSDLWPNQRHFMSNLDLQYTGLTGLIPTDICQLKYVTSFMGLTAIPSFLTDSTLIGQPGRLFGPSMQGSYLFLINNSFSNGAVPAALWNVPYVDYINLSNNKLTTIGNLQSTQAATYLKGLTLDDNLFVNIPQANLVYPTKLSLLSMKNNLITQFPASFTTSPLSAINTLDLSGNQISTLPSTGWATAYPNLLSLTLDSNSLRAIPDIFGGKLVTTLIANNNNFNGLPPASLSTVTTMINLNSNQLSGDATSWLTNILTASVSIIFLNNNSLSGGFPWDSVAASQTIGKIDIGRNSFSGAITSQTNLAYVDTFILSHNQFTGPIPDNFATQTDTNLQKIDFSYNSFSGNLPSSLMNQIYLGYIDLSHNQLTGTITAFDSLFNGVNLMLYKLNYFDLSTNALTGNIPTDLTQIYGNSPFYCNQFTGMTDCPSNVATTTTSTTTTTASTTTQTTSISTSSTTTTTPTTTTQTTSTTTNPTTSTSTTTSIPTTTTSTTTISTTSTSTTTASTTSASTTSVSSSTSTTTISASASSSAFTVQSATTLMLQATSSSLPTTVSSLSTISITSNHATTTNSGVSLITSGTSSSASFSISSQFSSSAVSKSFVPTSSQMQTNTTPNLTLTSSTMFSTTTSTLPTTSTSTTTSTTTTIASKVAGAVGVIHQECIDLKASFPLVDYTFDCATIDPTVIYPIYGLKNGVRRRDRRVDSKYVRFQDYRVLHVIFPRMGLSQEVPTTIYKDLSGNQMTGTIPTQIGLLPNLQAINLAGNQIYGNIPVQLGQLKNLESLNLAGNTITGGIPPQLGNLINLQSIDLSGNDLTGGIPVQLAQLTKIQTILLSGNELTGTIPSALLLAIKREGVTINFGTNCLVDHPNQRSRCKPKGPACRALQLDPMYLDARWRVLWDALPSYQDDLNAFDKAAKQIGASYFGFQEYEFQAFRLYARQLIWCMTHHPEYVYLG